MHSIGIIGQGFVGTAVREGMRHALDVFAYDRKNGDRVLEWRQDCVRRLSYCPPDSRIDVFGLLLGLFDGPIFLCLPTPMLPDGQCDTSIVEGVLCKLDECARTRGMVVVVAIKSTIPPGTTDMFNEKYPYVDVCFQPEFLTEVNAQADFNTQNRVVCGGSADAVAVIRQVYSIAFPTVPFVAMSSREAELVKYFTNVFLAAKVSIANEFKQIADALGVDYDAVMKAAKLDPRLGVSHWGVPGPDGHKGFGGSCLVKDLSALICVAERLGVEPVCLAAAWRKNLEVRPERDWEQLKGRAVVGGD